MDEVGEFDCILDEEYWYVVVDQVEVVFVGIEFYGEVVYVMYCICGFVWFLYGGEMYEDWGMFVCFGEEVGFGQVVEVFVGFEVVMCC